MPTHLHFFFESILLDLYRWSGGVTHTSVLMDFSACDFNWNFPWTNHILCLELIINFKLFFTPLLCNTSPLYHKDMGAEHYPYQRCTQILKATSVCVVLLTKTQKASALCTHFLSKYRQVLRCLFLSLRSLKAHLQIWSESSEQKLY